MLPIYEKTNITGESKRIAPYVLLSGLSIKIACLLKTLFCFLKRRGGKEMRKLKREKMLFEIGKLCLLPQNTLKTK